MVEFKVGDRVKWRGFDSWQNCTIQRMDDEGAFVVGNDNEGDGYLYFTSIDLIKPEPTPIPADIAERALVFVRQVVARHGFQPMLTSPLISEARAILDALKPVDGDLVEARAIAIKWAVPGQYDGISTVAVNEGRADEKPYMDAIKEAIAKGRELEREGK